MDFDFSLTADITADIPDRLDWSLLTSNQNGGNYEINRDFNVCG